jgi:hypothetical protein
MDFVPGFARRLGHSGNLFFEPAMGRSAAYLGGLLCPRFDLAAMAVARTAGVQHLHLIIRRRCWVVDIDYAVAPSTVAA